MPPFPYKFMLDDIPEMAIVNGHLQLGPVSSGNVYLVPLSVAIEATGRVSQLINEWSKTSSNVIPLCGPWVRHDLPKTEPE